MSESAYNVDNVRVYGQGKSYILPNKIIAEDLCETLNQCLRQSRNNRYTDEQLDKISKQIIQTKLSLHILEDDLTKLESML